MTNRPKGAPDQPSNFWFWMGLSYFFIQPILIFPLLFFSGTFFSNGNGIEGVKRLMAIAPVFAIILIPFPKTCKFGVGMLAASLISDLFLILLFWAIAQNADS